MQHYKFRCYFVFLAIIFCLIFTKDSVFGQEESYVIKKGDNLWLISEKFFKDPYKWLELWKVNPKVPDPHWIYPGFTLKIPIKKQEEKPATTQTTPKEEVASIKVEEEPVKELVIKEEAAKEVEIAKETKPKLKKFILEVMNIDRLAFFSEKPLSDVFKVISSEEKIKLGNKDVKFFIDGGELKGVKKGDYLTILKPFKELKDDKNNKLYGYLYAKVGNAQVIDVYPQTAVIKVLKSYAEIEKDDILVYQLEKDNPEVVIKKAEVFLEGSILELQEGYFFAGERNFVFLDKGKKDGLERGDVLKIEKQIEGMKDKNVDVGRLVVIKNWDNFSAAYVLEIKDVVTKGDRFSTFVEGY